MMQPVHLPMALAAILIICAIPACPGPDAANQFPREDDPIIPQPPEAAVPFGLHPLRAPVAAAFIRGADISNCYEIEQHGGVYRDFDGTAEDIMKILADSGINHVRARLWLDPDKHPQHYAGDGNNTIAVTMQIAARAKAAGMGFMLDLHYSDWWANPAAQQIPHAWKDAPSKNALLEELYRYTKDTIAEFIAAGGEPDTVKIGNEISDGLLSQHSGGSAGGTGYRLSGWQDYSDALQTAAKAVREAAPNAKIIIHLGDGGVGSIVNIVDNFTGRSSGQAPLHTGVDYDVIGLSWYPIWAEHLSIDSLYANIRNLIQTFGKEVMVCETGSMWTVENYDNFGNYAGAANEAVAANLLTDMNGFVLDSNVEFAHRSNGTVRYVPSHPENQARVIRAIMDAVAAAGGMGVVWWGADWMAPVPGLRSNAEMGALFDNAGKALPAIRVLGGLKGADAAKPGIVTGLYSAVTGDTATLRWNAVNGAVASKYQLERAQAADGPWATVSDMLTGGSCSDMGLAEETAYYYRVRAYNANGWGDACDAVKTETAVFEYGVPEGLRVTAINDVSVTLEWNTVTGAASYKLYAIQSAAEPAGSAYVLLGAINGNSFTHSGLSGGDTWWYKASAVYGKHGEGPVSAAVSATAGTELDLSAAVNMANAVLDDDFLDSLKSAHSANCSTIMKTDGSNYQIKGIYAANDSVYLYIALDYGKRPAMWQNDWITVWIDNTNSTAAGAVTDTGNFRVAQKQAVSPAATIEFSFSHCKNSVAPPAVAKNTAWENMGSNLQAPGAGDFVIKYRVPLAGIGGAEKNNLLRILVSNTQGWSGGTQPRVGCIVPADAAAGAFADSDTVTINMEKALLYTVK